MAIGITGVGREEEDMGGYPWPEKPVFPTDKEFIEDTGLQQTYNILEVARKYLKSRYPHVTHIGGWKVPK